ncbi:MAG: MEMO1 family protein [Candidatus Aenigmatarchaeota archaeon]
MVMILIRQPVAAGTFYSYDAEALKKQIYDSFSHRLGPKGGFKRQNFIASIVPHAGYIYSGPIAAWVYSRIERANYVIFGPNHSGMGAQFALMRNGLWKTPLGEVAIQDEFAEKILKECEIVEHDIIAHQHEHSIEVQLPFLQYRYGSDFKFIPIAILNEFADEVLLENCKILGKAIANVIKKEKEKWIILASSDFSHYVPQKVAKNVDLSLIKEIKKLDEKKFFEKILEKNANICGFGGIASAIVAAKELGAKKVELLKYATSGDVTKEFDSVVGYASVIIY